MSRCPLENARNMLYINYADRFDENPLATKLEKGEQKKEERPDNNSGIN